jgi:S1-C subfamily serine protease
VASVAPRSPASRAGLRTGDVIVAIDGHVVDDPNAFDYRFTTKPLGQTAQVGVLRGGRETRLAVALETAPDTPREEVVLRTRSPFQGSKVANLSPALADELRLDSSAEGVVIVDIADNALARNFFRRGDRIVSVNNDRITRTRDLERIAGQNNRVWRIVIERGGKQLSLTLGG